MAWCRRRDKPRLAAHNVHLQKKNDFVLGEFAVFCLLISQVDISLQMESQAIAQRRLARAAPLDIFM